MLSNVLVMDKGNVEGRGSEEGGGREGSAGEVWGGVGSEDVRQQRKPPTVFVSN